jgi:colanic acid/amylovoran biosynthesis glycosyltransferase
MKVAVVVGQFPVLSETFIVNQIASLIDSGNDVQIFSYQKSEEIQTHKIIADYHLLDKCTYYQYPETNYFKRLIQACRLIQNSKSRNWEIILECLNVFKFRSYAIRLTLLFRGQWFIEKNEFDVIHVHFGTVAIPIADLIANKIVDNTPVIVSFHGYDISPDLLTEYQKKYRDIFQYCSGFTVNSLYSKNLLAKIYSGKNVYVLPVGLDTEKFQKKSSSPITRREAFTVLFCGRLINWKAPDLAIDIVEKLIKQRNHKDIKLKIIGDGPMKIDLLKQIEKLDLSDHIEILGAMTQEAIFHEMENADVFLYPGIHDPKTDRAENQGLVLQEAQSMQLPVIISDAGGMKYGVIDNETGFVVKEGDIDGFVDKLEILIKSEDQRLQMGSKGRSFVQERFDSKFLGQRLTEIYKTAISDFKNNLEQQ